MSGQSSSLISRCERDQKILKLENEKHAMRKGFATYMVASQKAVARVGQTLGFFVAKKTSLAFGACSNEMVTDVSAGIHGWSEAKYVNAATKKQEAARVAAEKADKEAERARVAAEIAREKAANAHWIIRLVKAVSWELLGVVLAFVVAFYTFCKWSIRLTLLTYIVSHLYSNWYHIGMGMGAFLVAIIVCLLIPLFKYCIRGMCVTCFYAYYLFESGRNQTREPWGPPSYKWTDEDAQTEVTVGPYTYRPVVTEKLCECQMHRGARRYAKGNLEVRGWEKLDQLFDEHMFARMKGTKDGSWWQTYVRSIYDRPY